MARDTPTFTGVYPHQYVLNEGMEGYEPRWAEDALYDEAVGPPDRRHRPHRFGVSLPEAAKVQQLTKPKAKSS